MIHIDKRDYYVWCIRHICKISSQEFFWNLQENPLQENPDLPYNELFPKFLEVRYYKY